MGVAPIQLGSLYRTLRNFQTRSEGGGLTGRIMDCGRKRSAKPLSPNPQGFLGWVLDIES